jgi:hypothetical protein
MVFLLTVGEKFGKIGMKTTKGGPFYGQKISFIPDIGSCSAAVRPGGGCRRRDVG